MPHTTSAEKRLRQMEKRRARNRASAKVIKLQVRTAREAITGGDPGKAKTEFVAAAKRLDKAAAKGRIHKNKAARLKSRLAKRLNKTAAAK